jgi:hypothetical protein
MTDKINNFTRKSNNAFMSGDPFRGFECVDVNAHGYGLPAGWFS